jgi:hypothetical protein
MDSLTDEELAEIDTRILAGEIIEAIRHIMMSVTARPATGFSGVAI